MFTPTLDHLHILVMLVIALFSFRAYNSNTLAIQYQPQEEKTEATHDSVNQDVAQHEQSTVDSSQMRPEQVDNAPNVEDSLSVDVVQVQLSNSIIVEEANSVNIQSDLSLGQNKLNEINTVQGSIDRIEEESVVVVSSETLEKEEDQESTLIRGESRIEQEECEEENVECSSSSEDSSSNSSGYPDLDEEKKESHREKRKRIQKAKRVQKKNLRREQQRAQNHVVEVIEIN